MHRAVEARFLNYWAQNPGDLPNDPALSATAYSRHSRGEYRHYRTHDVSGKPIFKAWGAKTSAAVQYDHEAGQTKTTDVRYFISSREMSAREVVRATRERL